MPPKRPTREQLIKLAKSDPEAIADLVLMLWDRVEALEAKVRQLERNSRNSSKPPSSDAGNFANPPKPKSLRKKSGRKPGAQNGHRGGTLERSDSPEHIEEHRLAPVVACPSCGKKLEGGGGQELDPAGCECRQVFELPAIRLEVTEHRAERRRCPDCATVVTAEFPSGVNAPVQYGQRVRATAIYLGGHHLVPYHRLSEIFGELFHCPLSVGTLANFVKGAGKQAAEALAPVRDALVQSETAHADETSCRVQSKLHWLHVLCTPLLTSYHIDPKRGAEGMDRTGLLSRFRGKLIHDCWSSYFVFEDCRHFLCAAHLLRELTWVHEEEGQEWAGEMIGLLLEAKDLRERHEASIPAGKRGVVGKATKERISGKYVDIVLDGLAMNPEPEPPPKGKQPKRSKALNLLRRLDVHYEEIMGFFEYGGVPFDNNLAERDIRMMKTRQKISGTFRSESHPQAFCDIRSIISTARKQSRDTLEAICEMLRSPSDLGESLAQAARS